MDTAKNEKAGMLAGQRALVTGANSGIGEQVAKSLAAAGASVAVNYVSNEEDAYQVVKDIESAGGKAMAIQADQLRPQEHLKPGWASDRRCPSGRCRCAC